MAAVYLKFTDPPAINAINLGSASNLRLFMHYYQFNIGDYAAHTKGLSLLEDLAYRRLLDEYYLAERPLHGCLTDVARMIGMGDYSQEVGYVLGRFFIPEDESWRHIAADRLIFEYQDKHEKAKRAGKASANARKATDVERTLNGRSTYVQPTINQEPITNNHSLETPQTPAIIQPNAVAKAPAKIKKGSRLPNEWVLPKDWGLWAIEKGLTREQVLNESEKFRNYWVAKSGKDAAKLDWGATWRNWILKAAEQTGDKKTFYQRTKEQKKADAEKRYEGLLTADQETLKKWGL